KIYQCKCKLTWVVPRRALLRTSGLAAKLTVEHVAFSDGVVLGDSVNPAVIYGHENILEKQNALCLYTKLECGSLSIVVGSSSFNLDIMLRTKTGQCDHRPSQKPSM
ncbi:hypothetical protein MAR_032128, partial [Mya arenaria]